MSGPLGSMNLAVPVQRLLISISALRQRMREETTRLAPVVRRIGRFSCSGPWYNTSNRRGHDHPPSLERYPKGKNSVPLSMT